MSEKRNPNKVSGTQVSVLLVSLLVLPLIPGFYFGTTTFPQQEFDLMSFLGLFLIGYAFSFAFVMGLALPLFVMLLCFGWVQWWSVLLLGAILGSAISFLIIIPRTPQLDEVIPFGVLGLFSAAVFWLMWAGASG